MCVSASKYPKCITWSLILMYDSKATVHGGKQSEGERWKQSEGERATERLREMHENVTTIQTRKPLLSPQSIPNSFLMIKLFHHYCIPPPETWQFQTLHNSEAAMNEIRLLSSWKKHIPLLLFNGQWIFINEFHFIHKKKCLIFMVRPLCHTLYNTK